MNKLLERKLQGKEKRRKEEKISFLLLLLGLLAFICFIYSERQYDLTIVQFKYVVVINATAGVLLGGLTYVYRKKNQDKSINAVSHFVWAIIITGSITSAIFLSVNKEFPKSNDYIVKSKILERHEAYRHSTPYIRIDISGFTQDIHFPNNDMTEINNSNFVILTLKDGFFGFPVIIDKKLSH